MPFAWMCQVLLVPWEWEPCSWKLRYKPRPPTFRRKHAFANWKLTDAAYSIMAWYVGPNGNNVEAGLKGNKESDCQKSTENHVISCSTKVWLLPNSQHLFFNTSNLVMFCLHQYLESTREQLSNSLSCLSADGHSWIVPYRTRSGEAPLQELFWPWALFPMPATERGLIPVGYCLAVLEPAGRML